MFDWLTFDNLETVLKYYEDLGPFLGIFLTFLEAFMPFLPLIVIVVANASAYGLVLGFLLSWLGTVLGAYCVFLLVRKFGKHSRLRFLTEQKNVKKLIRFVDMRGMTLLLVLLCFPFTPVIVVNIVAGLSNIKRQYYFITLLLGKPVMILFMSYIGNDLRSILTSPMKLIVVGVSIIIVWLAGKAVETYLNKKVERDLRSIEKEGRS